MYRFLPIFFFFSLFLEKTISAEKEEWIQKTTSFFEIYFQKKHRVIAEYTSKISDEIIQTQLKNYPAYNQQKIDLILYDDLFSNGFANSYQNRIGIWISKWSNPLRGQHQWIEDVLTHEISHLLTIRQSKIFHPSLLGINLVYQDYFNERNLFQFQFLFPFSLQPHWFNEGVAQYESTRLGYDSWDSHRDMLLRIATLHDSLLNYQQMGVFTGKILNYELGPYTQGFSFVLFLSQKYGDHFIQELWKDRKKIPFFTLSSLLKNKTNYTATQLWQQWKNEITKQYTKTKKDIGSLVLGQKLTNKNFYNMYPKWGNRPNQIFMISNYKNKKTRSLHLVDFTNQYQPKIQLVDSKIKRSFSFNHKHKSIIYSSEDKNLILKQSQIDSNFQTTQHKTISDFYNSLEPHIHKNKIVFIREHLTRFLLYQANIDSSGSLDHQSIELLFPFSKDSTQIGFKISFPKYSPNGNQILFSYFDGESSKIGILNLKTEKFNIILSKKNIDFINPEWLDNEQDFIFSSNYNKGIYNLYLYQNEKTKPLTNVLGGAFQPSFNKKTQQIAYIGYDIDGFSLYLLDSLKPLHSTHLFSPTSLPKTKEIFLDPSLVEGDEVSSNNSKPYSSIQSIGRPIFQPILSIQERSSLNKLGSSGDPKFLAGLNTFWNDPLQKHSISLGFFLEINSHLNHYLEESGDVIAPKQDYDAFINYQNRTTSFIFDLNILYQNINSFDTITDRSQGSLQKFISKNSQSFLSTQFEIRYPFRTQRPLSKDESHFIGFNIGYQQLHFNFYDIPFRFNSFNDFFSTLIWNLNTLENNLSPLIPTGLFFFVQYSLHWSDLIRGSNSFRDNFKIDQNGLLKEQFQNYRLQKWYSISSFSFELPWFSNHVLKFSNEIKSILSWSLINNDTNQNLNSFFKNPLDLRGLSILKNTENFFQQGLHSFRFAMDYFFPIWKNINCGFDPLFLNDLFFHTFTETGQTWNQQLWNITSQPFDKWHFSAGWGIELSSIFYYHFPIRFYFESASVFNRSRYNLNYLKILGYNTYATEIKWGITLGLYPSNVIGILPKY